MRSSYQQCAWLSPHNLAAGTEGQLEEEDPELDELFQGLFEQLQAEEEQSGSRSHSTNQV